MQHLRSAELVRDLRERSGRSQRDLARRAGTSGPTVAAYEAGTKEPRLSTLERLAEASGHRLSTILETADDGNKLRRRRRLRSLGLAAATAQAVSNDWDRATRAARQNLERMATVVGEHRSHPAIAEWHEVLSRGPEAVRNALLDPSPHGDDLRQMQPFAGVLSDRERRLVLAATTVVLDDA